MADQLTGHMVPEADIETVLADPGGVCPGCVRIVIEGFRAEVEQLRVERDEARKQLATATNALYWVGYQLSKHVDYGGDIQDAHDTARDAYRRITSDGTEAGQTQAHEQDGGTDG